MKKMFFLITVLLLISKIYAQQLTRNLAVADSINHNPVEFVGDSLVVNANEIERVAITNVKGQRVMEIQYPDRTTSVSNLINGVYVITLFTKEGNILESRRVQKTISRFEGDSLVINSPQKFSSININDSLGRRVMEIVNPGHVIHESNLMNGFYTISFYIGNCEVWAERIEKIK